MSPFNAKSGTGFCAEAMLRRHIVHIRAQLQSMSHPSCRMRVLEVACSAMMLGIAEATCPPAYTKRFPFASACEGCILAFQGRYPEAAAGPSSQSAARSCIQDKTPYSLLHSTRHKRRSTFRNWHQRPENHTGRGGVEIRFLGRTLSGLTGKFEESMLFG